MTVRSNQRYVAKLGNPGTCQAKNRNGNRCQFLATTERSDLKICGSHARCYDENVEQFGSEEADRRIVGIR